MDTGTKLNWALTFTGITCLMLAAGIAGTMRKPNALRGEASWFTSDESLTARYGGVAYAGESVTKSGATMGRLDDERVPYAAMWDWDRYGGRWVRLCNENHPELCTYVVIKDRGPHPRLNRLIDVNPWSIRQIGGLLHEGLMAVTVEVLNDRD